MPATIMCSPALASHADPIVSGDMHLRGLGSSLSGHRNGHTRPGGATDHRIDEGPHQQPFLLQQLPAEGGWTGFVFFQHQTIAVSPAPTFG